jgi:hypothetical protein
MTPDEVANLPEHRPDSEPPGFGRTILARIPAGVDPRALLERVRGAWMAIASWGRWSDAELGAWPSTEEGLGHLPKWLRESLRHEPPFEAENLMDDLHDREWVWWSGATLDHLLKIDLSSDGLPISTWTIEFVIEKAGAAVAYNGDWLSSAEALSRVAGSA